MANPQRRRAPLAEAGTARRRQAMTRANYSRAESPPE
jgi:hypothetical protein